ncbi:MAG: hypothetical protein MJ252_03630 [archaeon]|nr:hypothetical protein [archaeon]
MNKRFLFVFFVFLFLLGAVRTQFKIFPDVYIENDAPFNDYRDTTVNLFYQAGYFSNKTEKIYSEKMGFTYNPEVK